MKDDEVSTIFNKTRDYFSFVKSSLLKKNAVVKAADSEALEKIDAYLKVIGTDTDRWNTLKANEHKSILSNCFRFLQLLDRIANDYKLFQNGSVH